MDSNAFMAYMNEYQRLYEDVSVGVPEVGDRVVVAAGIIFNAHPWLRLEGEVIEVGNVSAKVRLITNSRGETAECWIPISFITDILGK